MKKTYSVQIKICDFLDPLQFLAAAIEELRQRGVYSHRLFNRACGFASPNFVQLVIQGKRNLSEVSATKVGQTLGLNVAEVKVFLKMLKLHQQVDPAAKMQLLESLLQDPLLMKIHQLSSLQMAYYKDWYNIPIREILGQHPNITSERLSVVLIPAVSIVEVEESLSLMQELGLIVRKGTAWSVIHEKVFLANDIVHQSLRQYHRVMLKLAAESIERFAAIDREISCITFRLTAEDFALLKERIRAFKQEILARESSSGQAAIYQFNFQLFPLSQPLEEKKS